MKSRSNSMQWNVLNFDCNAQKITTYDVLMYRKDNIKELKKKYNNKDEFSEKLKLDLMCQYWSRAEYELIIKITEDDHVILYPWCGCRDPEKASIDVTSSTDFDWKGFADKHHIKSLKNKEEKFDVYDQLCYRWDEFLEYCWSYFSNC